MSRRGREPLLGIEIGVDEYAPIRWEDDRIRAEVAREIGNVRHLLRAHVIEELYPYVVTVHQTVKGLVRRESYHAGLPFRHPVEEEMFMYGVGALSARQQHMVHLAIAVQPALHIEMPLEEEVLPNITAEDVMSDPRSRAVVLLTAQALDERVIAATLYVEHDHVLRMHTRGGFVAYRTASEPFQITALEPFWDGFIMTANEAAQAAAGSDFVNLN